MKITLELIIALCALGLTVYQAWLTRRHNRLAVMPHLDWNRAKLRNADGTVFRFLLKNTGIGPAIIRRWAFLVDDQPVALAQGDLVEELAARCFNGKLSYVVRHHSLPGIGSIMPPNHEICVAEVFFPGLKTTNEPEVEAALRPLVFKVTYESFYRQRFTFSTDDIAPLT